MDLRTVRRHAQERLQELHLPRPFTTSALAASLAEQRARPLHLLPKGPGDGPCGVWFALDGSDYVFYDATTQGLHPRHVSRRSERPLFLGITVALVSVGLLLVHLLGGPAQLVALIVAMIACAVVGLVVSLWWKLSMHTVVLTGSVAVLAVVLGPWALLLGVLVVAVGWARVVLHSHTPAQVAVGAVVGAAIAAAIMTLS